MRKLISSILTFVLAIASFAIKFVTERRKPDWVRLPTAIGLLVFITLATFSNNAYAIIAGTTCGSINDVSTGESLPTADDVAFQQLNSVGGCIPNNGGQVDAGDQAVANAPMWIILNSLNDTSPLTVDNFRIDYHGATVTNVRVNGNPYGSTNVISVTAVTNFTVQYEHNGIPLQFTVRVDPISHTLGAFTVQLVNATTASDHLANQQSTFTQLIVNHQSYNMISGVGGNLDGLFNQNGIAPFVSMEGFQYQSYGASKYREKKQREALAKKQPQALDILAKQSKSKQDRLAKKYDTTANLMAYQSDRDDASSRTVKKLNAAAQEDIYAADLGVVADEAPQSPWNFWVKGSWSVYDDHDGASFDGHMIDVLGGVDYRVNDDLVVGLLAGYGVADFDTLNAGVAGSFEADGVHVGAYLGKRLAPNLLLDALIAYTASDYDNRVGTTTGSFDAHRVTAAAHLKGSIDWGMVTVQPTIGIMVASERQDSYRDSAAVLQSARTVVAGRLSIGPKFLFEKITHDNGSTQFWFAAKGEYDFSNQSTSANSSLPDLSDVASARLQAGIIAASHNGINLSLQGDLGGLGSNEFLSYSATTKVSVPF